MTVYASPLIMIWVSERLFLSYIYKQPPMFDDKLSNTTVDLWGYGFLIQMFFGYRMFNNGEFFDAASKTNEDLFSVDTITGSFEINHTFPFIVFGVLFIIFTIWDTIFSRVSKFGKSKWGYEGLPPFQHWLKENDVDWILSEEKYLREKENIKILSDRFYESLNSIKNAESKKESKNIRKIQNTPTYDILANQIYQERFQYFSVNERGQGSDPIFMSNNVRKLLRLFINYFLFSFDKKYYNILLIITYSSHILLQIRPPTLSFLTHSLPNLKRSKCSYSFLERKTVQGQNQRENDTMMRKKDSHFKLIFVITALKLYISILEIYLIEFRYYKKMKWFSPLNYIVLYESNTNLLKFNF